MRAPEGILVALVFIVLGVLASLVILSDTAEADIFFPGDWVVDTDLEYDGETIIVRGNVAIKDGGSLTLRNSTLLMDSRRNDAFALVVETTGNMYSYDSTITNRYTDESYHRYFFNVYNDTVFVNTDISRLYGWSQRHGGLRLYYGNHFIKGCNIFSSSSYGIYARTNVIMKETHIYSTSWDRFVISTNDRLYDIDFIIENCTFSGSFSNPYRTGVSVSDGFATTYRRYVNITGCNFDGLSYGVYSNPAWRNGVVDIVANDFDRCVYGIRAYSADVDTHIHHNHYTVRSGGYGLRLYEGSNGNLTWMYEDIRGAELGWGTGVYLEGAGTGEHIVRENSIWNTYYGIIQTFGHCTVVDSYINVTNNNFYVYYGAQMDIYSTVHKVGSGFVDTSGGRITGWQRLNISSVTWSDGTPITEGLVYLLNETDFQIGNINLSMGPRHLDFKRWEATRMAQWNNIDVYPALLDVDTWFRADPLDHMISGPQDIVFTDDFVPRITMPGLEASARVNVSYLILEGTVVERGRGLVNLEVSLDGETWHTASITDETWTFAYNLVSDGLYNVSVRATDKAGNVGLLVRAGVIVDTMPPPIDLLEEPPLATNQPILILEGWTEPHATIYVGNVLSWPDDDGNFEIQFPLSEGANPLVIKVQDVAGNWNQSVYSVMLDSIPPSLTLNEPDDGLITNDPEVIFSGGTGTDVTITVDGYPVSTYKGAFTTTVELAEGEHLVEVEATDLAGNANTLFRTVTVDITAPDLSIESPAQAVFTTTDDSVFIAGRMDDAIDHVFINGERMEGLPGEFAIQVDLAEGDNPFTVVVRDAAGNDNRQEITITRDTRAPKFTVDDVEAQDGEIIKSDDDKFSSSDTLVFHVRVDEHAIFTIGLNSYSGDGQFTIVHELSEGTNSITIEVADAMGNLADPWHDVYIFDFTAPAVAFTYPADGFTTNEAELTLTGVTDDLTSKVWINDVPAGLRSDGGFTMTVTLEQGDNVFSVRNRDRAGNEATAQITVKRKEKQEVQESNVGVMAIALVVGLVIGIAVMYVIGRKGGAEPDVSWDDEPGDRRPPPPPPPPEEPPAGGGGDWNEY
jgi:hypothetical protein